MLRAKLFELKQEEEEGTHGLCGVHPVLRDVQTLEHSALAQDTELKAPVAPVRGEQCDQDVADDQCDLLDLFGELAQQHVKGEVVHASGDDRDEKHDHPDKQVARRLLCPGERAAHHVPGKYLNKNEDMEPGEKEVADKAEHLFDYIKHFFQIITP